MKRDIAIMNEAGLHARPAALFVREANKYKCEIKVEKEGRAVNAKSILGVLSLGINKGCTISIIAEGPEEGEAIKSLGELIEGRFGEE